MKNKKFIDFGAPGDVVTEDNLKEAYSIDVKLIELDENRKVCVPMKTKLKIDIYADKMMSEEDYDEQ